MVAVSIATRRRTPAGVGATMLRLHACETLRAVNGPAMGAGRSPVAFLERVRIAGVPDGEHGVGELDAGRQAPGQERERPVRLRAVRPDLVDHDVTERDALPVVRPGRGAG